MSSKVALTKHSDRVTGYLEVISDCYLIIMHYRTSVKVMPSSDSEYPSARHQKTFGGGLYMIIIEPYGFARECIEMWGEDDVIYSEP